MRDRGWTVITVDVDPTFNPTIVADIRTWSSWTGQRPDLIWCSPPCTEFSRLSQPWFDHSQRPDLSLVESCRRIIRECAPTAWIIENVKGAIPYLGKPRESHHPYHLWGNFPPLGYIDLSARQHKQSLSSRARARRAAIPYPLSLAVARAVEMQEALWLP
jgi:hypothetical protein